MLAGVAVLCLGPASAIGGPTPPNYEGKVGTGALGLHVKFGKSGKPVRIMQVEWDAYDCGADNFTGGSSKSIKVRPDRTFKSTQRVGGIDQPLNFTIKGSFSKDGRKATGTIKVETCVKKRNFSATKHVEA